MTRAYEEIVEFIAAGTSPRAVVAFQPSEAAKARVADLVQREKTTGLSPEETAELDHYLQLEHLMRLAKARARTHLGRA
jgi:DNA polymerase/3'-5' exonuclease PolX